MEAGRFARAGNAQELFLGNYYSGKIRDFIGLYM